MENSEGLLKVLLPEEYAKGEIQHIPNCKTIHLSASLL